MSKVVRSESPAEKRAVMEAVRGVVFDVQRMSLHDGPGMRTNVFLKGCPLRCGWCANPESQVSAPQLTLQAANCIACGQFAQPCAVCGRGADGRTIGAPSHRAGELQLEDVWTDAEAAARVELCPTGALHWIGEWRTAAEVMAEVRRDRPFYGQDGGLTLTGGEPTMQPALCEALLWLARQEGIATAMETCGHTQWAVYERLLPWLDLVLFDVKHVDSSLHRQFTGFDNTLILANLAQLTARGAAVRVRIPLIPGFNADPQALHAIATAIRSLPGRVQGVDLLPYHTLGKAKYAALGRAYPWEGHARLGEAEVAACAEILRSYDLSVTIGG
jgi:pyruvate formate lyase activating enzyme